MLVNKEEIRKLMKQGKLSSQKDLNAIFRSMIKDAIETIYEGELTEMLGYEKYERKNRKGEENEEKENNARNGYGTKRAKSTTQPMFSKMADILYWTR